MKGLFSRRIAAVEENLNELVDWLGFFLWIETFLKLKLETKQPVWKLAESQKYTKENFKFFFSD